MRAGRGCTGGGGGGAGLRRPVALALGAALCLLGGCAVQEPTAASNSGQIPNFGWPPPRMRPPSAERPAWLPTLPPNLPRYPLQDSWRDTLG